MKLAVLCALPLLAGAVPQDRAKAPVEVAVRVDLDGEERCTLRAEQVPIDRVMDEIARALSSIEGNDIVLIEGFTPPLRAALVTAELKDRPLTNVLEWVLGSVGLDYRRRPGVIRVQAAESAALSHDELYTNAVLSYARATRHFPDHPHAAAARLSQGMLEEGRGNLSAALSHYEVVQESYRDSPHVPEAIWRRGKVLQQMGSWAEANLAFRVLANSDIDHPWQGAARLEMARCATKLGDPLRATHVLAALRDSHPAQTHAERVDRTLISALAQMDSGEAMACLRELDDVLGGKLDDDQRRQVFALQARAFEDLDMFPEAAWAWQVYADHVEGTSRISALENAARLSLAAGEEINVLFLEKLAARAGDTERLAPFVLEAKIRLGLVAAPTTPQGTALDSIQRASQLLDSGDLANAARLLEPIFLERASLPDEHAMLLYPLWGRCLAERRGLESAVRMLRTARTQFEDLEHRRRIDLATAAIFEEHELYDRAVEAYEGRY